MSSPVYFTWLGAALVPLPRFYAEMTKTMVVGGVYAFERVLPRSKKSHDHFFAVLHEAWLQLPEFLEKEFQNEVKFRKWLLVEAGYCNESRFKMATNEDAERFAAYCAGLDEYARIDVVGEFVSVRKAMSQSEKAMGRKTFQESKDKVFQIYHKLTGIDPTTLQQNAGKAA